MFTDWRALWRATIHMLAISALWYGLEFMQYGTLQWDRQCDNVIGIIFLVVLWYAYHQNNYWMSMYIRVLTNSSKEADKTDGNKKDEICNSN